MNQNHTYFQLILISTEYLIFTIINLQCFFAPLGHLLQYLVDILSVYDKSCLIFSTLKHWPKKESDYVFKN